MTGDIIEKISFRIGGSDLLKYCEEEWAKEASHEASKMHTGMGERDPSGRHVFQCKRSRGHIWWPWRLQSGRRGR